MKLEWVPSDVGVLANQIEKSLATDTRVPENPTIIQKRLAEARLLLRGVIHLLHTDESVSRGTAPPPVPTKRTLPSDASQLHHMRSNSSFMRARLQQLNRLTISDCPTCINQEDLNIYFFLWKDYTAQRSVMNNKLVKQNVLTLPSKTSTSLQVYVLPVLQRMTLQLLYNV